MAKRGVGIDLLSILDRDVDDGGDDDDVDRRSDLDPEELEKAEKQHRNNVGLWESQARRQLTNTVNDEHERIMADWEGVLDNEDMWDEIKVEKPRKGGYGMLSALEKEKIYQWLLARDKKFIREHNGSTMTERNYRFLELKRRSDPVFRRLEQPAFNVAHGDFAKLAEEYKEISWRATSQPMGHARLARKAYTGFIGIPEEEVKERLRQGRPFTEQEIRERKRQYEREKLWEDIQSGRVPLDDDDDDEDDEENKGSGSSDDDDDDLDDTKERKPKKNTDASKKKGKAHGSGGSQADSSAPSTSNESFAKKSDVVSEGSKSLARVARRKAMLRGDFSMMRHYTTLQERTESMTNWNAGNSAEWDLSEGFPSVSREEETGPKVAPVRLSDDEKYRLYMEKETSAGKHFIKKNDSVEALYVRFREKHMLLRAKKLVEEWRRQEAIDAARKEEREARHALEKERLKAQAEQVAMAAAAAAHTTRSGSDNEPSPNRRTAKAKLQAARDAAIREQVEKKMPHNVGASRVPAKDQGRRRASSASDDGDAGAPGPPDATPLGPTPDQTARMFDEDRGAWGFAAVPAASPGDADDEASPEKGRGFASLFKRSGKQKSGALARRSTKKTREVRVESSGDEASLGGSSPSRAGAAAWGSPGGMSLSTGGSVGGGGGGGGVGAVSGSGRMSPTADVALAAARARDVPVLRLPSMGSPSADSADGVGATATPDGGSEAGSGGKKGRKKRHHKKRGDGSVDGSADGSGPADSASSVHAMSPSPQSSPSSLLSPFSPSSLALAFSPVSPLSPGLSATLDKLRSPLSRVRIDELQIAAQLMAEDGMQRLAEASAAAAQAALDIARDQFREHIQEAFVALSKTDAANDMRKHFKEFMQRHHRSVAAFEDMVYTVTNVRLDLRGIKGQPKQVVADERGSVVGALLEQQQLEELERALTEEKEADDDAAVVENLYRVRENEQYRANFIHNQLDKLIAMPDNTIVYGPEELIVECKRGKWRKVIDIVNHPYFPISPNAKDPVSKQSATYATLLSILTRSNGEVTLLDADNALKRMVKYVSSMVFGESVRLDWVVKILLDRGGDVNFICEERGEDGCALLHKAAILGNLSFSKWLLKKGADARVRTSRDYITPLMFAAKNDAVDLVMYLLEFGKGMSTVNWVDVMGQTVLHYACMGGSPLLVHVLLTCGCLHTTRSKAGLMAIDVARVRRREDICGIIARHVNSHPDHVVRMEFASLLFPKKGQITDVDHDLALLMGPEGDEGGSALARVEEEGEEEDGEAEEEEGGEKGGDVHNVFK